MNYYSTDIQLHDRYNNQLEPESFQLTPEEERILKECAYQGIIQRGIPTGIMFGIGGLLGARTGMLMSKRFGVKPAVIGLGILGYLIGRFTYNKDCIRRCLELPDGNLRKMYPQLQAGSFIDPTPEDFYLPIEVPKTQDPVRAAKSTTSDIELPTTSNFDTIPSEYYETNVETPEDQIINKNYTSYDDLRKQNRLDYANKFYADITPQQRIYSNQPQDGPVIRRPNSKEMQPASPLGPIGENRTKYGDTWNA